METRRLAVLCSHLSPSTSTRETPLEASTSATQEEEKGGGCTQDGCVFCRIVRGEAPAFKLYEDDVCLCILDSKPLTLGHALIIPKCHFPSLETTPPSVVAAMCSKVPFLSNAIMRATQCDSFNFLVNNGKAAGQVIFHTHFHIIPRKAGDKLWPSESFRRTSIVGNPETASLVACIKDNICASSCDDCKINASPLS
ncbi:Histidine triad nucleotide-binding protein 1 [Rhynchospora pubera]|uniref:Histidine triad nucleotide-binding protein 1 n=1 Tax=Rhynchospora pubera TaxID=906938 RepID=A0AAV8FQH3_9POAL|nr:Histidine triad nucleotide-binding protein 1 [Rhynchospora pubera]KAJ4795508.1 Histidine triad nucleotide-binding protein 1 [Rhynchospora pubera]